MSVSVVTNPLKPAKDLEDYLLHCAALEWGLAEPIIINSAEDIKSRADWKDRVQPFRHQVENLMRFCRRLPVTLLADDVGLGKTISAGLIISELMKRSKIHKVLVVCPKILMAQWKEELDSKFGISAYEATGRELRQARNRTEPVIVTTYQSATNLLQGQQAGLFDMLILDEAHKVRNLYGTPNPPQMAKAIFGALQARMFKYVLMLTATPIQNRLWDIYSLVDCLAVARGHTNPLGTPDDFANRFIADGRLVARRLEPSRAEEFRRIVGTYMFRTRRVDAKLKFPDRKVQLHLVRPGVAEAHLQSIIAANISRFNALQQSSLLVALMSSPHALAGQLDNMAANRTAPFSLAQEVRATTDRIAIPAKAQSVLELALRLKEQRADWRMVVFTTRKETQAMIGEVLQGTGIACGFISGNAHTQNQKVIEAFRQTRPSINVIVSTDAGAEGVNLQSANILVNYDLPWNPMIVEQRIGRVQRIGSQFKEVWVANIVHRNSPEQHIVARLMEKLQIISHTVGDIEAVLEANNDANGDTLEKQIREMVIKSLQGQNIAEAARLVEESIEKARRLIEESQAEIDSTLGTPDQQDNIDIPMPRLSPAIPSMNLRDFVLRALKSEGAVVSELGNGLFTATSGGLAEERFTFEEEALQRFTQTGPFLGRVPLLYQPGKRDFERLVQRWIDRSAAFLVANRSNSDSAKNYAHNWLAGFPQATLVAATETERQEKFAGSIYCRVRASNALDSFEKMLSIKYEQQDSSVSLKHLSSANIRVRDLVANIEDYVAQAMRGDSDLGKFSGYYEARLRDELKRSDTGDRQKKLVADLKPVFTADASAVYGKLVETLVLLVKYRMGGDEVYQSRVKFVNGKVVEQPERQTCSLTNLVVPVDCLETCSATGQAALREKLQRSEFSGEYAVPGAFVTCEITGKQVHTAETGVCAISGKRACLAKLVRSEMSGRLAVAEHVRKCEITGATVLIDERSKSSFSGKRFRSDQVVRLHSSKDVVHASEATKCAYCKNWYLKADCETSDVTGQPVAKERIAVSAKSGRKCDLTEIKTCSQTGMILLPDEVGICEITGKTLRLDLLRTCPETGLRGQDILFVVCQESHERVAPSVIGQCCITGKNVRKSLLGTSDASGKSGLKRKLVICQKTGKTLLPSETAVCSVTGRRVDARLLRQCVVSGKSALKSEMAKSPLSGKWMLPEHTQVLSSGERVGKLEVAWCHWTRDNVRVDQIAVCRLLGLTFTRQLLNSNGEFCLLRNCLDGKQGGTTFPEPTFLSRIRPDIFSGVHSFQIVSNQSGTAHIMFGTKSFLGLFNKQTFAVLAYGNYQGFSFVGCVLFGKIGNGAWQLNEKREF